VLQTRIVTTAASIDTSSPTALKQRSVPLGATRLGVVRQTVWAEVADVQTLEVAHKVSVRYPTHKPTTAVNTHTRLTALLVYFTLHTFLHQIHICRSQHVPMPSKLVYLTLTLLRLTAMQSIRRRRLLVYNASIATNSSNHADKLPELAVMIKGETH